MNKITKSCVVKLLPIIYKEEMKWITPVDRLFLSHTEGYVYDTSSERILRKLAYPPSHHVSSFSLINILEEKKINTVLVSAPLKKLVVENFKKLFNVKSDYHINVILKHVKVGDYQTSRFLKIHSGFEESTVIKKEDWKIPVSDITSGEEWKSWIKTNQDMDYINHIEKNSIFGHKESLLNIFGIKFSEILAENRAKRISQII